MATIRFRRALLGNMTEFLRVGGISAEILNSAVSSGLIRPRAQTNSEWFMRTPRDAYMDSNMVRADFGSGMI